ncbi:MAG: PEP-CTERM sorting domain-containing protein [Limisphaerales bacterium]
MKITIKTVTLTVSLVGFLTGNAVLAQNAISNPGFDTGDLTDWTQINAAAGATISVVPTGGNPTDYAWLDNTLEGYNLALSQTTANGSFAGAGITVDYSFDLLGGNQAAGGVDFIHIFDENSSGGVVSQGPGLLGPYFPTTSSWTAFSGSFTTVAGSDHLYIEFDATTGANVGSTDQMGIDNVTLTQVPEPTTLALTMMGMIGVWAIGRRRNGMSRTLLS